MTRIVKFIATLASLLWLAAGVLCVLPEEPAHALMNQVEGAASLWHSVTRMQNLPGPNHSINPDRGVTTGWHQFLQDQAPQEVIRIEA